MPESEKSREKKIIQKKFILICFSYFSAKKCDNVRFGRFHVNDTVPLRIQVLDVAPHGVPEAGDVSTPGPRQGRQSTR